MAQFQPGQSGNPAGRKKGECKKYQLFKELVEPHTQELVNQALKIALSNDKDRTKVLTLFLERILPAKPKDNVVDIELTGDTPTEKSKQVIEALSNRYITPSEAMDMLQALAAQTRVFDADELAKLLQKTLEFRDQLKKEEKIR